MTRQAASFLSISASLSNLCCYFFLLKVITDIRQQGKVFIEPVKTTVYISSFSQSWQEKFCVFLLGKISHPSLPQEFLHNTSPSSPFCVQLLQPSQSSEAAVQVIEDIIYQHLKQAKYFTCRQLSVSFKHHKVKDNLLI